MMTKDDKSQLALEIEDPISPPTPAESRPSRKVAGKTAPRASTPQASGKAVQPYLPGLSRRGRPRLPESMPASQRARESRQRRVDAGVKRLEILLEPEVAAALLELADHYKASKVEVLSRLITRAAKQIRRAKE